MARRKAMFKVLAISPSFSSFSDVLVRRARETPDCLAYVFLEDGETESARLTFGELDERARTIAAALTGQGAAGERVLLLFPPGLDFIAAFFGCLYAGAVAVPSYPPAPPRSGRGQPRLRAIVEDAAPGFVLTTTALVPRLEALAGELPGLATAVRLATDALPAGGGEWQAPALGPDALAFLQYTSGSTAEPKGVMVSHGNLLHNEEVIREACGHDAGSTFVSWLPMYHDMGLIGGLLQPLYVGASCALMAPVAFLQRPVRWLRAISRYRAHTSGAPDFAYDLCARKITPEQTAGLDLSTWRTAFDGSEPVRARTLAAFTAAFAPCGFRPETFFPCYGLAEATLIVSGRPRGTPPTVLGEERPLVGCGPAGVGLEIAIVDPDEPETAAERAEGEVGEIWVAGPSVARGYWGRPELSDRTFRARLTGRSDRPDCETGFLRTGDLGFLRDGELFVTGRLKDLIVVRGRNLYPQDLELTACESHPALRGGVGAAFAVETAAGEAVALVLEAGVRRGFDTGEALAAVRQAIAEEHEASVHAVLLVRPGGVPRTTSGKVQRQLCRRLFLEGALQPVAEWRAGASDAERDAEREAGPEPLALWLRRRAAARLDVGEEEIDPHRPLTRYGLDSLAAVELAHEIEAELGVELPLATLLASPGLADLAARLEAALAAKTAADAGAAGDVGALTPGERALWFLQQLDAASPAYHLAGAARLSGEVDEEDLRRSFTALVARHPALRTTFEARDGEPRRHVHPEAELDFAVIDATRDAVGWSAEELSGALEAEAFRPFDLARGPLLRLRLFRRSPEERVLLLVLHHLVADFWSLALLLRDPPAGPAPAAEAPAGAPREIPAESWEHWRERLEGFPTVLDLPLDHPRPARPGHRAGTVAFGLAPETAARLRALGRDHDTTLFTVLLALFQAFLHRITGRERLLIGAPTSGRQRAALAGRVGYFVDMAVLAGEAEGEPSFRELLDAARRTALAAFAHPVPFPALVERLQPERDPARTPFFQVAFTLQKAPGRGEGGLASFVLNEAGPPLRLAGLPLEPLPLRRVPSQLDLTLHAAEIGGEIRAALHWADDLVDPATAARWSGWLQSLAAALAAAPESPVWAAPLWSAAERWQVLGEWNDTAAPVSPLPPLLVHERIAARALAAPDALAIRQGTVSWTYGELVRRAWGIAGHLRALGLRPEARVAVLAERRPTTIAAWLGVLAAGGAYVPIDPLSPPERVAWLARDAGATVLLAERHLVQPSARRLPPLAAAIVFLDDPRLELAAAPPVAVEPENLAYVIHTSGSTGEPKGVAISHRALAGLIDWHLRDFAVTAGDVASHVAGLGFDAAVWEVWPYLAAGASLRLPDPGTRDDPERLRDWLLAEEVTLGFVPTPLLEALLGLDWPESQGPRPLRRLLTGGDRLRARPAVGLPFGLRNAYGPTEGTVVATSGEVAAGPDGGVPSLGRPIAGARLQLLDARLVPVPLGVAGELCLAGGGLARGYLGRPAQTAERFLPDPCGAPGDRLYRTGDLARLRPDGELEFLGRTDQQIKVRGVRVEPGEIERALASHPGVREALVLAVEAAGGARLAAFVVAAGEEAPRREELRDHLAGELPPSLVPSLFLPVPALPLTRNGKVDRRSLAELAARALAAERQHEGEAPRDEREELIAGVWAEVLELRRVGIHEDFFALGGHSLLATRVTARLRALFGVDLAVRALFETPTVAGLAARVAALRGAGDEPEPPLLPALRDGAGLPLSFPLSFAQRRLWFLHQLDPEGAAYHVPGALHLTGRLDDAALEGALAALAGRHEALRTTFALAGEDPVQRIAPFGDGPRLPRVDLRMLPEGVRAAEAERLAVAGGRLPFDLGRGPLLRALLLRLGEEESTLLLTLHHIVADGWSLGVLLRELAVFYRAFATGEEPEPLPPLPVQVADFAVWQRSWMRGEALRSRLDGWRERLAGAEWALRLPTDRPRPPHRPARGRALRFRLGEEIAAGVEAAARRQGATPFMVLLAAWNALLHRYTGQDDLSVGSPIAQRDRVEIEGVIGCFVNTLVLRTRVAGEEGFAGLLARVREVTLDAYEHQDLPFELLVEALRPDRDLAWTPLFQVLFVLQNAPRPPAELPGLALALRPVDLGAPKLDLILTLEREGGEIAATLDYPLELFDPSTIERLAEHFATLLAGALRAPEIPVDRLPLLSAAELAQLLDGWNPRLQGALQGAEAAGVPLHERFAAWAARTPEARAVAAGDEGLTYGELERRANRLAHHLIALGVTPGDRVGLGLERSVAAIVGILATLKAGAAWVPLDPAQPLQRLAFMAEDAGIAALVTEERLADALGALAGALPAATARVLLDADAAAIGRRPDGPPGRALPGSAPAYVLFTSGSTGRPKGVVCHHDGAVNLIAAFAALAPAATEAGEGAAGSLVCSLSFDVSVWEVFAPLTSGGRLEIAPERVRTDGAELARWLAERGVASAYVPPSLLPAFAEELGKGTLPPLARLLVGVEPIPEPLLAAIAGRCPGLRILNGYGPTEGTICATVYQVPEGPARERMTPIGRAVGDTRVYLLSPGLEPVPRGVTGEVHIGGAGVAQGYLRRPALTAERFLPDPFAAVPGARMYRTGDLARALGSGDLTFLGRADHQVKIRGVRVEPGEIEAVLRECPGVREALVATRPGPRGEPLLVAWLTEEPTGEPAVEPRVHLRGRLPEVMVPAVFVLLAALPVTAHGKIDRAALPDPDWRRPEPRGERVLPRTAVEIALADLWRNLLAVEAIGVHESFFDLGGHSLMAVQLVVRVRDLFGVELPVRAVFESPTIEGMAVAVGRKLVEGTDPELLRQVLAEI
jgi:amino acid adenylation domain-containing protein